jgi:hypothetical protein
MLVIDAIGREIFPMMPATLSEVRRRLVKAIKWAFP